MSQTPSIITPTSYSLGSLTSSPNLSITVTDPDNGTFTGSVTVDTIETQTFTGTASGTYVIDLSARWKRLTKQPHTITVTVTDEGGDVTTENYIFTKTNAAPVLMLSSSNLGNVGVGAQVSYLIDDDDENVESLTISLDGNQYQVINGENIELGATSQFLLVGSEFNNLADGSHTLMFTVEDTDGVATSRSVVFNKARTDYLRVNDVKKLFAKVIRTWVTNKSALDKLTSNASGDLIYDNENISSTISSLQTRATALENGYGTIVQALSGKGSTPASNSVSDIVDAIDGIEIGDETHGAITATDFDNMSNSDLLALSTGNNSIGTPISLSESRTRVIQSGSTEWTFTFSHNHQSSCIINKEDTTVPIYGVSWDGGSSPVMTRTDAAASFSNPSPAVNNGNGSSPFDNILPWSGMEIVDDATGGKLVSIPKYYYKWTKTGTAMTLQISAIEFDGSHVSPAHADRGDGEGERDVVYVGRYHCATSTYKSTTGAAPANNITRTNFRTNIHNLGSEYWQYDFAMYWTIMMLYLVEYANWNSQATIGYGCGNNSSAENAGLTDAMTYHTGTNAANRTTYGHTQYRHIEDLWGNVYDWCDGIYFSGADVYCIKNPASFSDTTGGTKVGQRSTASNCIKSYFVPTATGFEYALYPDETISDSNYETYVCDRCLYGASGVVLRVGGDYGQYQSHGAFYLYGNNAATSKNANIGSRLQKLPA